MPLFPIHDLRREDDIRMRRRRAALLLGGIVLGGWMLLGPAKRERTSDAYRPALSSMADIEAAIRLADRLSHRAPMPQPAADDPTRTVSVPGRLDVEIGCAGSITLLPVAGMAPDQVAVSVRHDQSEALQALAADEQAGRVGRGGGACDGTGEADFILRLSPDKPVLIGQWSGTDIHGGGFDGPVEVTVNGSGTVRLDRTGPLTVRSRSSGDVAVGSVRGRLDADLMSSGDLSVSGGEIRDLVLQLRSSGDVRLNHARLTGQASVATYSNGDVVGGTFAGTGFAATTHGSGDIVFSNVDAPTVELLDTGSGDINIRGGHVGLLSVHGMGSGDIAVRARVDTGRIVHHGSGDIVVPTLERQLPSDDQAG
jgi:hypothetical protein